MINIDLTTKNTVYNTLGPQAQWVQHRFGRRDYPDIELDLKHVLSVVSSTDDTINFISCFGDPTNYTHIIEVLENINPGKCVLNTHLNFKNDQIIELLNKKHAYVVVPLFGINNLNDKILLNSSWDTVLQNLKKLTCNVCIEFFTYEFNKHQIDDVLQLAKLPHIEVKINIGICTHPLGFSSIVNEHGDWLYDVYIAESKFNKLEKTVEGYNSLIQYIKPTVGKNILNKPIIYCVTTSKYSYDDIISISVTGDVFPSFDLCRIFSNALCNDWNFSFSNIVSDDKINIKEEFKYLTASIKLITSYLKQQNNLSVKDFKSILTNLTDSNI